MSIDEYIESLTNSHKDSRANRLKLSYQLNLPENEKLTCYSYELGNSSYNAPQLDLKSSAESKENKIQTTHDQASSWKNSSIKPRIRKATNLESNRFNILEDFQQPYVEVVTENSSSKSDESYITVNLEIESSYFTAIEQYIEVAEEYSSSESYLTVGLETESSYFTAVEDFTHLEKTSDNLKSEISFDSGIDEGKRDLITRLLQSKGDDFLSEEEILTDYPANLHDTQDLLDNVEIEQRYWNEDISEQLMYEERISRFFQTTKPHDPVEKEIPVNKSSRHYFMNLSDEHLSKFETRKSSNSMSVETSL